MQRGLKGRLTSAVGSSRRFAAKQRFARSRGIAEICGGQCRRRSGRGAAAVTEEDLELVQMFKRATEAFSSAGTRARSWSVEAGPQPVGGVRATPENRTRCASPETRATLLQGQREPLRASRPCRWCILPACYRDRSRIAIATSPQHRDCRHNARSCRRARRRSRCASIPAGGCDRDGG